MKYPSIPGILCALAFTATTHAAPAADVPENAYLFSYFLNNGEDGLHLAWSADGLKWQALNDGKSYLKPTVGKSKLMRDPCVTTGPDGTFHMVWTDLTAILGTATRRWRPRISRPGATPAMTS